MNITQAIRQRIEDLCSERQISLNKMCVKCGISQSTINNIINRDQKDVSILTIVRICNGLDITINDFFNANIFREKIDEEI